MIYSDRNRWKLSFFGGRQLGRFRSEQLPRTSASTTYINTCTDMSYLFWPPLEVNNVVFPLSGAPSDSLPIPTLRLGEREQNTLDWRPPRFSGPLRSSLCHKPVPKTASGTSRLPNLRKCTRASIAAVAQVYRVAKAVWSVPL